MTNDNVKSPFYILFVDDEEFARKYFEKGLKDYFNIMTAGSVDEATKLVNENHKKIAVVISDQRMPGGNGVKLLRFLRENYPHMIRLLTTAYSDLTEAIEAVNSGEIFRYIQKPWDYNLLKTELGQAMELFELRLEHNKLLNEKITVRKKMTKIERAKSLILTAKNLNFLRFSDLAVQNFIKKFVSDPALIGANDDWEEFDFGNSEVLETKFFLDLISRIQTEIPVKQDYNFNDDLDATKLSSLFEQYKASQAQVLGQFSCKINQHSFGVIAKKLAEISSANNGAITANKADGGNGIVINLQFPHSTLEKTSNIFTQNPQKFATDSYINLLLCYLLTWHHGGFIEINNDHQNFSCIVKLPDNPVHPIFSSSQMDSMENTILATMLF